MANKEFGIKEITIVGSTGSPTIDSPNNLNINANTVAISTNLTVGSDLTVTNNLVSNTINVSNLNITNASGVTTITNLDVTSINASGVSTFQDFVRFQGNVLFEDSDILYFGNGNDLEIYHNQFGPLNVIKSNANMLFGVTNEVTFAGATGLNTVAKFRPGFLNAELYYNGNLKFETIGAGVTVTGTTYTNNLDVSENVSVGGTISIDGGVTLATNNTTIVGTSGTAGEIKQIAGAPFYYDGSAWREFVLSSGIPVTVPADTEWDNVVFRATFDTDFTDAKFGATPVRISAGSSIVGAAVTIGTGAYRNDGTAGAGISYAYRSEYDFTGSWTIEFWIYHDSVPTGIESLVTQASLTDTSGDWTFGVYNNGISILYYWDNENHPSAELVYALGVGGWQTLYVDKWTHYALVREGDNGSLHFYINGVESSSTVGDAIIDNDILHINGAGLAIGAGFGNNVPVINNFTWNSGGYSIDAIFDDVRISCGVGTAGQRYNSIGISTYATFTPPTTELPTTGTLSSYVQPPGDKYGEITLGGSPSWRGTSGVTVTQQSSGNYRVSFASSYTNANDYYVLSQGMDQGFASYVGIGRSTTHVDLAINKQSDDTAVDTGALAVQIKNHI